MAVSAAGNAVRLTRLCLITPDAARLADFYRHAFGCRILASKTLTAAVATRLVGVSGDARSVLLALGAQHIELLQPAAPGRSYPASLPGCDVRFQHFAIVVDDMARAYAHLSRVGGWTSISTHGPQRLPASSGGVMAFKFRDPDGHPLELLSFASATAQAATVQAGAEGAVAAVTPFRGIDHSAISVADSARSIAFYEALGLRVGARSINQGLEQQRLDGLEAVQVEVVALDPRQVPPHVELLCYHTPAARAGEAASGGTPTAGDLSCNDVAATRLVFESEKTAAPVRHLLDPDGHRLIVC